METLQMVNAAYGDQALSHSNVFQWYGRFHDGRKDAEDDPRSGRPTECRNVIFFDWQGVIHKEFNPKGVTVNAVYYKGVMERLLNKIRRVRPGMCESGDWFLLHDNAPSYNATTVKQFLAQRKMTVFDHSPYSPDLAPADYFLFPKVKSHLKGRLFDSILDIHKAVTSTLTQPSNVIRGLLEKYPTFGREKETGLLGALDT